MSEIVLPSSLAPPPLDIDAELNDPLWRNPILAAEVAAYERMVHGKSSHAMIEESLRQHELNEMAHAKQRWQGQERWQGWRNEETRLTRIMSCYEFVRRLRGGGVDVWLNHFVICIHDEPIQHCVKKRGAIKGCKAGQIGVNARRERQEKTITTTQYVYAPEYSVMRFDQYNVPTREKYRGWRTALLVLILAGVLSEDQAQDIFGAAIGPASLFYRQQLYQFRNREMR